MTELIWEGKYKDGKKATPVRIALPFQTIETVNESAADRKKGLIGMFEQKADKEWRNRLIWGDKKYVLPSLLPEFAGKVNLIYIDPPFDTGANFSFTANIPDHPDTKEDESAQFVKEPSIIEQKAYRDTWGKGLDSYLQWFYETVLLLKELLAENGSIYVHLDWHVGHYAKALLDEIFGYKNLRNEIVWHYRTGNLAKNQFQRKHDTIFFYSKSDSINFTPLEQKEYYIDIYGSNFKPSFEGRKQGKDEKGIYRMSMVDDVWDISAVFTLSNEHLPYNTQKPKALLERIIKASSNEGDFVLDCFCGSGTTVAVAEKLNRRWITCDLGRFAIHTTRKRLLGIKNIKPFEVQNLGKYERQQWMKSEFENPGNRLNQEKSYKHFIIELYKGNILDGYTWLHGTKSGRMVHVGNVDAPVTVEDIKSAIKEFWKLVGKDKNIKNNAIDFLGWDFAFEVNETAKQFAEENKVNVSFKKIPREVLEKKAVDQGDIKFYELASLNVKTKTSKLKTTIALENFIIPPDDVPDDVRKNITHWSQWIDYWAIDWNYKDDTFHNEWQCYRTKQNPKIELTAENQYEEKGEYTVVVKVIDILGNDTTKAINITI
ncbi:MAG: site-specific DNA-methyltransferase [Bacteroidetes bacterium]|nr:site-specific DNA-methyltransferase [Bacteroidota bacterium]